MPLSNPVVNFEIKSAFERTANETQKILVFGQVTGGTATPGTVEENVGSANEQDALFGADSMAATAVRAIRRISRDTRVDVLPLSDGSAAVAATGQVAFTGTAATESGTFIVRIGSYLQNVYTITVSESDAPTAIATALTAAITADTTCVVNAVASVGDVDLTAANKGVTGNFIGLTISGTVAGITPALTAMTGGTGEPDSITDGTAFSAISSDIRYQGFVYPGSYDVATDYTELKAFLDARFNANNRILDGNAIISRTDTLSNLKALGVAVDDKVITTFGNKPVAGTFNKGSTIFELDYVIAAYFATVRALRLTTDAQIGPYIVGASGSLDDTGGIALASLPYMNTPFSSLLEVGGIADFWTDDEVTELLGSGISVIGNNTANDDVIAGQVVTTYLTDAAANSDVTFKYLNYFDTLTNIREYFFNNLKTRFLQSRLVERDITPLRNEANKQVIVSTLLGLYQDLETFVLVEKGQAARKFFKKNLTVTIDKTTGSASVSMLVSPVVQLRTLNIVMQVVFNIDL